VRFSRHLGVALTGIWLIATGIIPLIHFSFTGLDIIMAVLAILAGLLLLLGR
jgi:hypothetical protein